MANLFNVHTPFQLFVAQQIIVQEKLTDNILIYGYCVNNSQFFDVYDEMIITDLWNYRIEFPLVAYWATWAFKINDYFKSRKIFIANKKKYNYVIDHYNVTSIYFGDIHSVNCQFLASIYKKRGLQICFFEEGSSHYFERPLFSVYSLAKRIYLCMKYDLLYYLPYWGTTYAKCLYLKSREYSKIPMDKRYSIVPFYHEKYDVRLYPVPLMSEHVRQMVSDNISSFDSETSILYLSEPFDEELPNNDIEMKTLKLFFQKLASESKFRTVYIKFHPREKEKKQQQVIRAVQEAGFDYQIISAKVNIPVEYYLQAVHFKRIYTFFCSTAIYNGYLFEKTEFVSLLKDYYKIALTINSKRAKDIMTRIESEAYKRTYTES